MIRKSVFVRVCVQKVNMSRVHLTFPGGGTFFWWQLGAVSRLCDRIDVHNTTMEGIPPVPLWP